MSPSVLSQIEDSRSEYTVNKNNKKGYGSTNNFREGICDTVGKGEGEELEDGTKGVRHGFGVQIWPDGAKYRGMWVNNKAEGKGTFSHADGDEYEGEFRHDKSNGYGVYKCADGTVYEGIWVDDV